MNIDFDFEIQNKEKLLNLQTKYIEKWYRQDIIFQQNKTVKNEILLTIYKLMHRALSSQKAIDMFAENKERIINYKPSYEVVQDLEVIENLVFYVTKEEAEKTRKY